MQKIVNGELLAIGSIPLAAALMARGVAYNEGMPWQAGAAPVALVSLALSVKYVKAGYGSRVTSGYGSTPHAPHARLYGRRRRRRRRPPSAFTLENTVSKAPLAHPSMCVRRYTARA